MPETPAQRAARERNLRKGNPSAYGKAQGDSQEEPPTDEPKPDDGPPTFRARAAPRKPAGKTRRKPAARRTPPRAPSDAEPPAPSSGKRGNAGGFFDGLLEGLRG